MRNAFVAALQTFMTWLLGGTILKGIFLTLLSAVVAVLGQWLWGLMPDYMQPSTLTNAIGSLPSGLLYWLTLLRFDFGAPLCIAATVISFLIRRLPIIG